MQKGQGAATQFKPIFLAILKFNQFLTHIILFVFERASYGYLASLNRSSIKKVMTILWTLRKSVKSLRKLSENSWKERNCCPVKSNLSYYLEDSKFTMFKLFSNLYIPHNLIHNINLKVSNPSPSQNINSSIPYFAHN